MSLGGLCSWRAVDVVRDTCLPLLQTAAGEAAVHCCRPARAPAGQPPPGDTHHSETWGAVPAVGPRLCLT